MSAITIGGDLVHYEKLGRGRPVILVHGWIGAWRYWIPLMQQLHLKYSVYTLDLIGFGDSAKNPGRYDVASHVTVIEQFMEQLGIPKAALIGHGLGAMVITEFALKNPDKTARLLLSNAPLFDPGDLDTRSPAGHPVLLTGQRDRYSLSPPIPDEAEPVKPEPLRPVVSNSLNPLKDAFNGRKLLDLLDKCFKRSEPEYDKIKIDVEKADDRALASSLVGYGAGQMLDNIRKITAPTLIVHGNDDPLLPIPGDDVWNYLTLAKEDVLVPIPLEGVRHFPMLESDSFPRLTTDFLEATDLSRLEVRERWMRRSR